MWLSWAVGLAKNTVYVLCGMLLPLQLGWRKEGWDPAGVAILLTLCKTSARQAIVGGVLVV